MGIKWQGKVANLEVVDRADLLCIKAMILKTQITWTGHVARMEPHRIPRQRLYGEPKQGPRPQGHPKRRFKDHIIEC